MRQRFVKTEFLFHLSKCMCSLNSIQKSLGDLACQVQNPRFTLLILCHPFLWLSPSHLQRRGLGEGVASICLSSTSASFNRKKNKRMCWDEGRCTNQPLPIPDKWGNGHLSYPITGPETPTHHPQAIVITSAHNQTPDTWPKRDPGPRTRKRSKCMPTNASTVLPAFENGLNLETSNK